MQCKQCNKELEIAGYDEEGEVYIENGLYGCDSGCEVVRMYVECPCGFTYNDYEFGSYYNEEEWREELECLIHKYERSK